MVAFEVHRMADISRSQLVSACRTLGVKIGDVKSSSKITVTALVAKALVEQGVVRAVNQPLSIFESDTIKRSALEKAKTF